MGQKRGQEMHSVRCRVKLRPLASARAVGNGQGTAHERQGLKHPREGGRRYDSVLPSAPRTPSEKLAGPHDDLGLSPCGSWLSAGPAGDVACRDAERVA